MYCEVGGATEFSNLFHAHSSLEGFELTVNNLWKVSHLKRLIHAKGCSAPLDFFSSEFHCFVGVQVLVWLFVMVEEVEDSLHNLYQIRSSAYSIHIYMNQEVKSLRTW